MRGAPDLEAVLEAAGVRVVFFRQGDRYAHRVEVFDASGGDWRAVLETVEGMADEVWPASPPLQHLHVEKRAEGPVALLVGMAGRTHWSAAVEVATDGSSRRVVRFDIAARVTGESRGGASVSSPRLGSTYRDLADATEASLQLRPLDAAECVVVDGGAGRERTVRPAESSAAGDAARTIAWRYVIEQQ